VILLATTILLNQGACDITSCDWFDIDHRAHLLVQACGEGPRERPRDADCIRAMSAIWGTETAGTWSVFPPYNGTGCGPAQVVPHPLWGNTRLGRGPTPSCSELRVPRVGLRWGVKVLRAKAIKFGWRPARVFEAYNGSDRREAYALAALRRWAR